MPGVWIKSLHYRHDDWTIDPGQKAWISDPGKRDKQGIRIYRNDGQPAGEPSYKVDDLIYLYFSKAMKVPLLVKVTKLPKFAPDYVQRHNDGGEPDAGERWPWLTGVGGVDRIQLDRAPDIDDLGIRGPITRGLPHFRLSTEQHQRLLRAFG